MGTYDSGIQIPISGQSASSAGFGVPVRNAIIDLDRRVALLEAAQVLPTAVTAFVNSTMTITSTTFAALPTPLSLSMTNPSSDFDLYVDMMMAAWMANDTANELQACLVASGGVTIAAGANNTGGHLTNGEFMLSRGVITATEHQVTIPVKIPAGAAAVNFSIQARRTTASGTQSFNFPAFRANPRRFAPP